MSHKSGCKTQNLGTDPDKHQKKCRKSERKTAEYTGLSGGSTSFFLVSFVIPIRLDMTLPLLMEGSNGMNDP